jgi:hypothetical protein
MPEIGTSGLMRGDEKRGDGQRPQATAPILDSTGADMGFDFVRPFAQAGISDERLPAGLRQILASKTDFSGSYPSEDRHDRSLIFEPTITCLKTSRPLARVVL